MYEICTTHLTLLSARARNCARACVCVFMYMCVCVCACVPATCYNVKGLPFGVLPCMFSQSGLGAARPSSQRWLIHSHTSCSLLSVGGKDYGEVGWGFGGEGVRTA